MTRLHARVLLDTGPSEDEVADIKALFHGLGLDATAEGHSYGGPPPSSAFLIVVNVPVVEFLDSFSVQGNRGTSLLQSLARELLAMRADVRMWGRPHGLRLEDSHGGLDILLPHDLPEDTYASLLDVDLSGFDRSSLPSRVEWHPWFRRWQAYPTVGARRVGRRLPARRRGVESTPGVRQLAADEVQQLWATIEHPGTSVITWQRAQVVLWSGSGWSVGAVARKALMSERRVTAIIDNFNAHGTASLSAGYTCGESVELSPAQQREIREIAGRPPGDFGLPDAGWTATSITEFLVTSGVVEDIELGVVDAILQRSSMPVTG